MNNTWKLDDGRSIKLLTVKELRALPGDTRIMSIGGEERLVEAEGMEPPDDDTRFGYSAWGITPISRRCRNRAIYETKIQEVETKT